MSLIHTKLISGSQFLSPGENDIDTNAFRYKFIAEGDSWFSLSALPGNSLLNQLAFDNISTMTVQFAFPGDTLQHMSEWLGDPNFSSALCGRPRRQESAFDALLISAGGNDLIDALSDKFPGRGILKILRPGTVMNDFSECINEDGWALFENYLVQNFKALVSLRDSSRLNKGIPMFVHTYDYPMPRNAPAFPTTRQYLIPAFNAHNVHPAQHWLATRYIFERFAKVITSLQLPNVHVVNTIGKLTPADPNDRGNSNDWLNEIHPNAGGYRKLAAVWREAMLKVLR